VSELLPCPCCESTNLVGGEHSTDCVYCKDCWLRAVSPDAWNTRANHLCVVPSVEVIAETLCKSGGFDPGTMMANGGPRWRYYEPQAAAIHNLLTGEA